MPPTAQLEHDRITGEEPTYTCPMIDAALSNLEHITDAVSGHQPEHLDEYELRSLLEDIISGVEYQADNIVGELERVRKNAEDLRSWGDAFQRL